MQTEFTAALEANQAAFELDLRPETIERLASFCCLVQEHNAVLHLVSPSTPEEFAIRHVLESLALLKFLPLNARVADVGPGAGFPSVPCVIARGDLSAVLIEAKEKKSRFLQKVLVECGIESRATVVNRQFSEIKAPEISHVTCRALDKFTEKLPQLVKWSGGRPLRFFGGPTLREEMLRLNIAFAEHLIPFSRQRFLFVSS